ncbi:hypothetical protein [Lacticaseibacillus paracasei]|uniref:hypothetical protein n=1 Tax=Lacticaseibacillus paracasei TaxID=1597 RepID=UPI0034E8DB63
MSNETKRDVLVDAVDALADAQASGGNIGHQDANLFMAEYDAALPDDLPVIPKNVSEYTKRMIPILGGPYIRDDVLTEPLFSIFLTIQHNLNKDYPPDFKAENWIIDHSDTFARAWLLGVWRVEETGEIVKLEEEK